MLIYFYIISSDNLENYVASGNYIQAANGRKIYISDITSKDPGSAKITTADGREYYLSKDSGPKVIDSTGNVLHMPPGEVLDALGGAKPTLDWSSYSDSYISTSPVAIDTPNKNKSKKLLPRVSFICPQVGMPAVVRART